MNTKKLVLTALAVTVLSSGTAFAGNNGNGNGNGASNNGNGHGASNNGNNGRGAIASELKWRNAAHASEQAFLNANPDSAVGKLATLRNATQATADALAAAGIAPGTEIRDPAVIQAEIDLLAAPTRTNADVQAEIDLLLAVDPLTDVSALELELAETQAYEALVTERDVSLGLADVLAAEAEAGAVVGVDDLSEEALTTLWDMLNN